MAPAEDVVVPPDSVVDPANLLEAASQLKELGNTALKQRKYVEAVAHYEKGVGVLDKCDGHPMLKTDVALVVQAKIVLYSNLAQALLKHELYRRAVEAATKCLELDPKHSKALYRRALGRDALKLHTEALADLDTLKGLGPASGMEADALAKLRGEVEAREKALLARLSDEAALQAEIEEEDDLGMIKAKQRFDEICEKYDMKDEQTAGEIADWLTRGTGDGGTAITIKDLERRWQMDEDDAIDFLAWIDAGQKFQQQQAEAAKNF